MLEADNLADLIEQASLMRNNRRFLGHDALPGGTVNRKLTGISIWGLLRLCKVWNAAYPGSPVL